MYAGVAFLMFVVLKQFYLFPSGTPNPADVCLAAAACLQAGSDWRRYSRPVLIRADFLWYVFLALVLAVNGWYAWKNRSTEYLKYSLFWVFNGAAVWCFRRLAENGGEKFFRHLNNVVKGNILLQFAVFLSGRGRIFHEYWGATRYMGTFNDPNQLAFFLFMMILFSYLYAVRFRDRSFGLFLVPAFLVILATKSTGILLGFAVFAAGVWICWLRRLICEQRVPVKWIAAGTAVLFLLAAVFLALIWPPADFDVQQVEYNMLTRIQEKIWKVSHGGLMGILLDRGMDKLLLYPQYLLIGAGEGGFARFNRAARINEIHSCLFSIWFCYGLVPMGLMLMWLKKNLTGLDVRMWAAVAGLLAESFFLINYRQPMFWMILLYGSVTAWPDRLPIEDGGKFPA